MVELMGLSSSCSFTFLCMYNPLDQFLIQPAAPVSVWAYFFGHLSLVFQINEAVPMFSMFLEDAFAVASDLRSLPGSVLISLFDLSDSIAPAYTPDAFVFNLSTSSLLMTFLFVYVVLVVRMLWPVRYLVVRIWVRLVGDLFRWLESLFVSMVGLDRMKYFSYVWVIFMVIALSNIIGMVPFFFTLTSHLSVTLALAATSFIGLNLVAIRRHGLKFFNLFIPAGAPPAVRPFLVLIEFISYFARVFSLAIRLFANMTAGHTLLKILAGYVSFVACMLGVWVATGVLGFVLIVAIVGLEIFIALLQAYVFTMLVCVYLNDVLSLSEH